MACSYPTTVCLNVHDVVRLYMQQLCGRHLVRKGRRVDVARRRFHFALKAMLNGPPTSSCLGFSKTSIATGLPQTARPRKETTHAERERSFPLPWGTDQRPRVHVQIQDALQDQDQFQDQNHPLDLAHLQDSGSQLIVGLLDESCENKKNKTKCITRRRTG